MTWQQVRQHFPEQWLLVEAIESHSEDNRWILDKLAVLNTFPDGAEAWREYVRLHKLFPQREFLPVHTCKTTLDIEERFWLGVRGLQAVK